MKNEEIKEKFRNYAVLVTNENEFKKINALNYNRLGMNIFNNYDCVYIYLHDGCWNSRIYKPEKYIHITYQEYLVLINKPAKINLILW